MRAEEELRKAYQEVSILHMIDKAASESLDVEKVLRDALDATLKAFNIEAGGLFLLEPDGETMTLRTYQGVSDEFVRNVQHIKLGEGISGRAVTEKRPIVLNVSEYPTEHLAPFVIKEGFKTLVSTPFLSRGKVTGAMNLATCREYVFKTDELNLLESIGIQLGNVIENALLYEGAQRELAERERMEQEKVELEKQLLQSQKMEAIGRLAGGIAHDFNNLLTIIKGYCQFSLMELKEDDPLRGDIEEIRKASEKAAKLTHQLLAFSRRQVMEMKTIDLNVLLINLDKMLQRVIGEDIKLITVLAQGDVTVNVDPGQIEQVIMNLAVNARDAMPNGGKLIIETANVGLDEASIQKHINMVPGDYAMLSINDTGVGMTPEVRERIFEPFFTTKEKGKGTGLGLSTAYGIVKQCGGYIWAYSELGLGTTFKIYLPHASEPAEELVEKSIKREVPRGSETILVVEDEADVRILTARILRELGYTVLEASNGEEVLSIYEEWKTPIDLVLTDVVMPKMSAGELTKRLKSKNPGVKILYMSGYTENTIVHKGILEREKDYIPKPFGKSDLARKVREVLDK
jgi:signal transduction histidine kinase/CheY-like chemotaxis protein